AENRLRLRNNAMCVNVDCCDPPAADTHLMPLYTPLSGSWLNMTESIQRIIAGRALAGQTPASSAELIEWLETTARAWNTDPTPFEWGGKRQLRRHRAYQRRHPLGGARARTPKTTRPPHPFME